MIFRGKIKIRSIDKNWKNLNICKKMKMRFNDNFLTKFQIFSELASIGNDLSIQEDLRPPHQRVIRIENQLPFDIAIWNISMAAELVPHFSVTGFSWRDPLSNFHCRCAFSTELSSSLPTTLLQFSC